jgi:phosphatidylinositol glycan class T
MLANCARAFFVFCCLFHKADAKYEEKLTLRPLPHSNKVVCNFAFSTVDRSGVRTKKIPNVVDQILTKYQAESFHLTFTVGKYSWDKYGSPEGFDIGPFGARLQVQLQRNLSEINRSNNIFQRWKGITAELGAIFSASLNQMDETSVSILRNEIPPRSLGFIQSDEDKEDTSSHFLHAVLAREELCTENLTPWLKMLPCRTNTGLGKLLDPIQFLSGEYSSLSIFALKSSNGDVKLIQHLTSIQRMDKQLSTWSLAQIFQDHPRTGNFSLDKCHVASKSVIVTDLLPVGSTYSIATTSVKLPTHNTAYMAPKLVTDLTKENIDLNAPWFEKHSDLKLGNLSNKRETVSAHRFITGSGQVHGGISVRIENNHENLSMHVTYHDILPWYLRVYFGTFRMAWDDGKFLDLKKDVQKWVFVSAEPRGRPHILYFEINIPPQRALVFSIDFEKVFLRLSEHPPDANRGFDIPSAVVMFEASNKMFFPRVIFTEPLLVPLPTPDFSMPYNVITLTSTVVAFFVGKMLNTLLRKPPRIKQLMSKRKDQ